MNLNVTERELVVVEPGYAGVWLPWREARDLLPGAPTTRSLSGWSGTRSVYEIDGVTARIEAEISKDEALQIARSMR